MMNKNCLTDLCEGQRATVKEIIAGAGMRRRLQDIGLIGGTSVECVQASPFGDPVAYLIRGAVIALRKEDSGCVLLNPSI